MAYKRCSLNNYADKHFLLDVDNFRAWYIEPILEQQVNLGMKYTATVNVAGKSSNDKITAVTPLHVNMLQPMLYKTVHLRQTPALERLGIKLLDYDPRGYEFAVLNYLETKLKLDSYRIIYEVVNYASKTFITATDETGRSLTQIAEEGYKGRRIDIMVSNYEAKLLFPNGDSIVLFEKFENEKLNIAHLVAPQNIPTMIKYSGVKDFAMLKEEYYR